MAKRPIHHSVTEDRVLEAVERANTSLDNPGICLLCGQDADSCEPDARRYECESCGERGVYGAEEVLIGGYYHR
jgi:hypothetical protein